MIKILLHGMACYIIANLIYTFPPKKIGNDSYWQPIIPRLIAVFVSCLVGIAKEFYDKWQGEAFSAGDLTVDFSGAFFSGCFCWTVFLAIVDYCLGL